MSAMTDWIVQCENLVTGALWRFAMETEVAAHEMAALARASNPKVNAYVLRSDVDGKKRLR